MAVKAGGAKVGELVVLQRDQRRKNHGRTVAHHPGELVDRRLAATGGQDRKDIVTRHGRLDRAALTGPQAGEAEPLSC